MEIIWNYLEGCYWVELFRITGLSFLFFFKDIAGRSVI